MLSRTLYRPKVFLILFLCAAVLIFSQDLSPQPKSSLLTLWSDLEHSSQAALEYDNVTLVVASQTADNTTWLDSAFLSWEKAIYVTDAPANLSVPANKGRESMVYLTYIIDNYDRLPSVVIFQHANRYQWHNDDPLYDGQRLLSRLRLSYVEDQGYVNLRCVWTLGCPVEIRPQQEADGVDANGEPNTGSFYERAFSELFPGVPVPLEVGSPCCAQFAATGDRIRQRPKADYESYRRWLLETDLPDDISGRVLEYSWHMIFGTESISCPVARECYCNVYGLCSLDCEDDGVCHSQYVLPKYSVLPDRWPEYDWEDNWRNVTQLRIEQEQVIAAPKLPSSTPTTTNRSVSKESPIRANI